MKKLTLAAILAAGCAGAPVEYQMPKAPKSPLFTDSGEPIKQTAPSEATVEAAPAEAPAVVAKQTPEAQFAGLKDPRAVAPVEIKPAEKPAVQVPEKPTQTPPEQPSAAKPRPVRQTPPAENPLDKLADPRAALRETTRPSIPTPTGPQAVKQPEYVTFKVKGAYNFSTPSSYGAFLGTFPQGKLNIDAALRASEITSDKTADDNELGTYLTGKTVKIVHTDKYGFEFEGEYRIPKELADKFKQLQEKSPAGRLFYHLEKLGKKELDAETFSKLEQLLK